jgi:GMP synthase (glutamine-hydrolysing)
VTGGFVRQPRLLVIQHNLDDSLNDLGGALVAAGLRVDTWCTFRSDTPPLPLELFDGVLSLGGTDSVADEARLGWIVHERRLIEDALAAGVPILGVCFGAQMLARAAGAEVIPAPSSEIGWHEVQMSQDAAMDSVLSVLGDRFHAFQFHYDTFTVPVRATVLGVGNGMTQVFRVGESAWGVQFHVEANPALIHAWLATYDEEMAEAGVDVERERAVTVERWRDARDRCERLATAFAARVVGQVGERSG